MSLSKQTTELVQIVDGVFLTMSINPDANFDGVCLLLKSTEGVERKTKQRQVYCPGVVDVSYARTCARA
jgi:hypothetical protein